ncbi:hypothetical protein ASPWEDRAFT_39876 [Aspergillus wentii DTO 134E9]|uniref:MARVEL domain-containing protein n=1 Tax=Aspergillus wentii DTO 134E9 TaxID=1073089 RepID=A0A1L9RIR4_ASPWE|nr:uncharacterized protein ASPWEDRAFT_39876 [Aspergillus wentii DTO 134E9]KAI9932250.1 hypothetical protein MW887_009761 [Aspergillus wentii]OJJ34791.1 hypothetical protein ASPWEDRAFT_39876 [Aspergillus wentii DTO 134E9]
MNSEVTLSGSYQASCTADQKESTYLQRTRPLGWLRIGLAFIIFGAAIAVVGCEAVPLQHYQSTFAYTKVWLYLWPLNFDLRPTKAILSCGGIIAFQNLVYIVAALLPTPRSRIRFLNLLAGATAVSGFITSLVGVLFTIYLPSSTYPSGFNENETLHSWTCKWKSIRNPSSSDAQAPIHFERDCTETQAAFVLLGILIGLEIIMGFVAAAGLWLERSLIRHRRTGVFDLETVKVAAKNSGF